MKLPASGATFPAPDLNALLVRLGDRPAFWKKNQSLCPMPWDCISPLLLCIYWDHHLVAGSF